MITQQKKSLSCPENFSNPLVLEEWDGKIYYRKGYREVLSGAKTVEQIMGSSSLQAEIISYILQVILRSVDLRKYRVHTSEPGIHISKQVNMAGDILVYDKSVLTPEKISRKYADVPPKVVIEVDISVEAEGITEMGYVFQKSERLIEFGCERVIWVLTEIQKVVVFTPGAEAEILSWHSDVTVLHNMSFNIGTYLDAEGISL
ncbi:Uma2 family endonuclease [Dyadobacter sp. BE34]|uniref:Uma2 family endonuclease n=1 Tax=Dyadobacter fermentans TaxID=94254 RepID=A0ABU1QPG0_9BACT|nr:MULTISPECIES: Uma2 family endonuclease [Dyadobacter]MDR6803036.1 Uma2 family endonuclease [Dyadobacter fermentans]MDR7040778.1 Uma2 family endonuclease [Dyadobacter sp. BE242]MDR7195180.1 Uma2 family endonuclease [Dyadobacter sp. BE34]MDR7214275.1 Uma2 family endonuclease [Dyadobacter sp. BE31]MDR7260588.1 Uma2 family endonuclease [Dyadobacter sp. BE32]